MHDLPSYQVLDPKLDRLSPSQLRDLQSARLRAMVLYCHERAPFWRRKFEACGLRPEDIRTIDDLPKLPFCTKAELQADQEAHPPFGSFVAVQRSNWARCFSTSGTTGKPLRRVISQRDWGYVIDRFRRNPAAGPGDIAVLLGPVDGLVGPSASSEMLACLGAMVVQAGLYDTRTKIRLIQEFRPDIVVGAASYLLHMAQAASGMGVDLAGLGIRTLSSVGEPGGASEATRDRLRRGWGVEHVGDGYGLTEIFPLGGNCRHSTSLHIASDMAAIEIVDPDTGQPLPRGEIGEVVVTNLVGDSQPLLRYRTRDIARIATSEACACGFTGTRLEGAVLGRVDDMIWFRGANVFPSAVEAAVRSIPELCDEFQIEISEESQLPKLCVRVEACSGPNEADLESLRTRVAEALREAIRVAATVEILPRGTLPRPDARRKVQRVVDRRSR